MGKYQDQVIHLISLPWAITHGDVQMAITKISDDKKKRLIERNKQISIAKKRGIYNRYIKQTVSDYE